MAMMVPTQPPRQEARLTAGGCLRRTWDYFFTEVEDPMAERKAEALLVAASVIAAMNYQAAISPPGGAYQETRYENGKIVYQAGQAIGAYVYPYEYRRFCVSNTISFATSMTTMFLFLCGLSLQQRIFSLLLTATMFATITATTFSYKLAMEATTPDHDESLLAGWHFVNRLVNAALYVWFAVAGITIVVFFANVLKVPRFRSIIATYRGSTH